MIKGRLPVEPFSSDNRAIRVNRLKNKIGTDHAKHLKSL